MKKLIFALALLAVSAYPEFDNSSLQWTGPGKVTFIKPIQHPTDVADGWVEVQQKLNSDGAHGEFWLNGNTASGKNLLAVLIAAQTSGTDIRIFYHKTNTQSFFGDVCHPIYSVSIVTP